MDHKETYIINKLNQLNTAEQNPRRAEENIRNIRQTLKTQQPTTHRHHGLGFKVAAGIAVAVGLFFAFQPKWGNTNVAWADVVEQFRSMSFYNAVLYFKEDAASEPKQIELWVSSEHKARVRVDSQVLFADEGKIVAGYNFKNRKALTEEQYDPMGEGIIQRLCEHQQLSLDNIVQMMCKGKLQEVTPNVNSDAMISKDLLVFDLDSPVSPEWMRIWALRESRLPVRLRVWDPRDGECMDAFVTYEKQQPAEFFDHQKYEQILKDTSRVGGSVTNKAYALLKDPGGKNYAPEDLFKESGYHMPQVEQVGVTEYGAVWVLSSNSENVTSQGWHFKGFGQIADKSGTDYRLYRYGDIEIFLPQDYPFKKNSPSKITLTCKVENHFPQLEPRFIGSAEVTDIQKEQLPKKISEYDVMLTVAGWYCSEYRFDLCERIIEIVQTGDDADHYQNQIDKLRVRMFIKQEKGEQAAELALKLWPNAYGKYKNTNDTAPTPYDLVEYIVAVAYGGQIDKAAQMWQQVKNTKHNLVGSKGFKQYVARDLKKSIPRAERGLSIDMARYGTSLEDIGTVIGKDVTDNSELKGQVEQAERNKQFAKMKADADVYLAQLSKYYDTYPLPERIELRERESDKGIYIIPNRNKIPNHEGYIFLPINSTPKNLAKLLPHLQGIYPSEIVSCQIGDEISEDLLNKKIYADVVRRDDVGSREAFEFALNHYGLEVISKDGQSHKVWVAQYNGKPLENYKNVHVPYPNLTGTIEGAKPGTAGMMSSFGLTLGAHLEQLQFIQNKDVKDEADKKIFIDETGLQQPISMETATWPGDEGFKLARQWFDENFGITFTEEVRPMPVLVIRKK